MTTKGACKKFKKTNGSTHNSSSNNINYRWAKDFNKNTLDRHFNEHGKSMGCDCKETYKQHAIKFANTIDKKNCESFVVDNGSTYKYNKKTNEFAIITKDGFIVTYFKPKDEYAYFKRQKEKNNKNKEENVND